MIKLLESYSSKPVNVRPVNVKPIKEEPSKEFLDLQEAIRADNLNRVKTLLDSLNDINQTDDEHWTILMLAVLTTNNLEIVKAILKKNPNLSIKNSDGETALDIANLFKKKDMIELLESYSSKPVNVKPVNANVRPVNANVKPKGRNSKCDIVDSLTVAKINEVFKEINQSIPATKVLKAERLQILKNLLGC
jgi:ankyrin repeat protein